MLNRYTYLHVVLGELAPKSIAIQHTEKLALVYARPLFYFGNIMSLGIRIYTKHSNNNTCRTIHQPNQWFHNVTEIEQWSHYETIDLADEWFCTCYY
jgi:hypothetical protein